MLNIFLNMLGLKKKTKIERFLDGEFDTIASRDIDPEGNRLYNNYAEAMTCKEQGNLGKASSLLEQSCVKPSIYKGHYRELFKIYRQLNREDLKAKIFDTVTERVLKMIRYDDEMIQCMLDHWGKVQKRKLPPNYFDKDRNFKVTDAKALLKASEALDNPENIQLAKKWIASFEQRKVKK